MIVRDIVKKYLEENGFDGLYEPGECACQLSDLMPCDSDMAINCEAGYATKCDGYDWCIGPCKEVQS